MMAANTTVKVATLTGAAKDDAFLAGTTALTEDNLSANLNVLGNDPGAAKLYSLLQNTSGLTSVSQFPTVNTATLNSGATITMNGDGTISYNASALHASLQSYAAGEWFTDTFTYTVRMANGALSTAKVTVEIAGANDTPTLADVTLVSILDTAGDDTPGAVNGNLAGADVDHGAVLTYGFADGVAFTVAEDGTLMSSTDYGTMSLNTQTGAYSFVADPDKIDTLAADVNVSVSFAVIVTDEHGAMSSPITLAFDLLGANDTAEMDGDVMGSVGEDGTLSASGTLSVSDRDADQSGFQSPASLAGAYGDFTFDTETGDWNYALRNDDGNVQALTTGQTVFDELVVTSLDGSASKTIHVDISGADEPAPPPVDDPLPPVDAPLPPVVDPVTSYQVNNGLTIINKHVTFNDFDANDLLVYSNNFDLTGISTVDTDGINGADSTVASFEFKHGNTTDSVSVLLVGYMSLTIAEQVVPA
jgi:VCBS repeat-containing protein